MATHMKTTVDIADALLLEAKEVAHREGTTMRALIEAGLREMVGRSQARRKRFALADRSIDGEGLSPEVAGGSWAEIRDLAYEVTAR